MRKLKYVLVFATLLLLLVGVTSAENVSNNTISTSEATLQAISDTTQAQQVNNNIEESISENIETDTIQDKGVNTNKFIKKYTKNTLKTDPPVNSWDKLASVVSNATSDTTIKLGEGTYRTTNPIEFNQRITVTIDGNGQTIDGNQQHVFNIKNGSSLVLKNMTIKNAQIDGNGGAIQNRGTLTITQSTLTDNNATNYGGAIYNFGTLTITQSTLTDNNATNYGGAIINFGTLTITQSTLIGNTARYGGAIYNGGGHLTITQSTLTDNNATYGGAIRQSGNIFAVVSDCNFTSNTASRGAAIYAGGYMNLTGNIFTENKATNNKETIDLSSFDNVQFDGNIYNSTDISLDEISLSIKDDENIFTTHDDITLNYTIRPSNSNYYKDFEEGISDITLHINGEKNITTKYENTTLTNLEAGKYEAYFTSCNQQSNTATFTVKDYSEITKPEESYEYYAGINNKIPLLITDPTGEKGNIAISVKNQDEYNILSSYYNIEDGYELPTEEIINALENLYDTLDDSYTINITYSGDYVIPSSTEFTLNINKQRNTTITYNIINNTEGNVQINITVQDAIYNTPIPDANIIITGDITQTTTYGIITDNTLTPGNHTINIKYKETDNYKESNTTIDFTVEIDKDKKITNLEKANNNLTQQLNEAKQEIDNLNKIIDKLTQPPHNTTITVNPIKSSVGSITTLTANILDKNNKKVKSGKVIFKINGITLKDENNNVIYANVNNSLASINYKVQSSWIKNTSYIEAVYSGTESYAPSRIKTSEVLNISQGTVNITMEKQLITAKTDKTITLRVKVVDSNGDRINNGKVIFKLNGITLKDKNGKALSAQVIDGDATLEYTIPPTFSAKTYTLTAVYSEKNYQRTETTSTLILEKKGIIINTDNITTTNNKTTIKATITDETGKLLVKNTKITIKVNGKTVLNNATSNNGKIDVSFNTTFKPGMYELLIISAENGIYKSGKMTTVLKI